MNIVLVIFDSLRKDCVGAYGKPFWWPVKTPHLDALAKEALVMDRCYPESLPTLPARRAIYTGRRVYPFHQADFRLKGDFVGAPGWGPIPEDQDTLAEILGRDGKYRTGLVSDVYHMFKPSKNYWRGFDQWTFLRGQEKDFQRSGPWPSKEELERWLPLELSNPWRVSFVRQCLLNMLDRVREEDYFSPRVLMEASRWLEQNRDAERFFLTVESFDPHEPWFVPEHYRRMYDASEGREQVISLYDDCRGMDPKLLRRTQANYSGSVTQCDRWLGHLRETLGALGLLENTLLIVTSDHGHSIGDRGYMGKRGYPSSPEVYDIPLLIRHPQGLGAGKRSRAICQHTDITALILEAAGIDRPAGLHGRSFWKAALEAKPHRDHATVGWGGAMTVVTERWWLNAKVDGSGPFLHDLAAPDPFARNAADEHQDAVKEIFAMGVEDAEGGFPDFLMDLARKEKDAPGCSALAARE